MMSRLFFIFLFISGTVYSQGLNTELGFNDDYDQSSRALVCVDDYSYFVKFQRISNGFFSTCALYKIDTTGNIIWNVPIYIQVTPLPTENTEVYEMIPSAEGGVYVLGFGMPTCDMPHDCFWFIQKFDSTGNIDWSRTWINYLCNFESYLTGISLNENNELLVNYVDSASNSWVYTIDSNGITSDSVPVAPAQLGGFCELTGYEFIAYQGDSLLAFDVNGTIVNQIEFNTSIQNIRSLNDSLYILTLDSVFIFDNNLNVLNGTDIPAYTQYSNLKVSNNKIQFISKGTGSQTILELDKQLQLQNTILIPVALNYSGHNEFNNSHFSVAFDFPITLHHVIRYLDYSLNSTQNNSVNNTDIGVIDVDITQTNVQPYGQQPGVYSYQIWANALIKNYGANVLNSCRINHQITFWQTCNEVFYTTEFTNLNLVPNGTMWINLGLLHSNINSFSTIIDVDVCVYTSHPNLVTDTIVSNDQYCKNIILGYVGLSENAMQNISVSPNPVNEVVYIENPDRKDISLFVYDSEGKVIAIENGSNERFSIDLSHQSKGLYLVRIVSEDAVVTKKIIKQ